MAYEQAQRTAVKSHSLSMENREKLSISGVEDVSGFDESLVVLRTSMGALTIRGEELHIGRIDLDSGSLISLPLACDEDYEWMQEAMRPEARK